MSPHQIETLFIIVFTLLSFFVLAAWLWIWLVARWERELLQKKGWREVGKKLWQKGCYGVVYTQREAIEELAKERKKLLRRAQR